MEKLEVKPIGITSSPESPNAYALILKEVFGTRGLPIIIGPFEAQSIAMELEGIEPPRPMTHDLMKNIILNLEAKVSEVFINDLRDGTFYARIIFDFPPIEIDARPSDAVALALRLKAPIYVSSELFDQAGINLTQRFSEQEQEERERDIFSSEDEDYDSDDFDLFRQTQKEQEKTQKPKSRIEELQELLEKAIREENYEQAAKIRDEIKKILRDS